MAFLRIGCIVPGPRRGLTERSNMLEQELSRSNNLNAIMSNCYGTENYYTNNYLHFNYTDGVMTFCDKASAFWLLDIVQSIYLQYPQVKEDLISITLMVSDDKTAMITFEDRNGEFYRQRIPYTDCPMGEWKFYFENDVFFWNGEY